MSCCETTPICIGGVTYNATIQHRSSGGALVQYLDANLSLQTVAPGTFTWGVCPVPLAPVRDVVRLSQPLVAGNNTITHGLSAAAMAGGFAFEYSVRNNANGADVSTRLISATASDFVIFVPVAVASVRITVDV